jgi:hypothetical protein
MAAKATPSSKKRPAVCVEDSVSELDSESTVSELDSDSDLDSDSERWDC